MSWSVNQRRCITLEEVQSVLTDLGVLAPDTPVIIAPTKNVPIEALLDVYDICRDKGLKKIQFAVNEPLP